MKKGDLVNLNKDHISSICTEKEVDEGVFEFKNITFVQYQLDAIDENTKYKIISIDSDGDIRFEGLPGLYPAELF